MINTITIPAYDREFWNELRSGNGNTAIMNTIKGYGGLVPPSELAKRIDAERTKHNIFRRLGTTATLAKVYKTVRVGASIGDAAYIEECADYPKADAGYTDIEIAYCKIAKSTVMSTEIFNDAGYDLIGALAAEYGRALGQAEERGCVAGDGKLMPYGILDAKRGADIGITASAITFDTITRLYLSLAPEHRQNGAWLMNDKTALMLRMLKDGAGNPLWRHTDDTVFDKPVHISQYMPNMGEGAKPIAFGDFSSYWFADFGDMVFRTLKEVFLPNEQIGVICAERVAGVLLKREAIKVLEIGHTATEA